MIVLTRGEHDMFGMGPKSTKHIRPAAPQCARIGDTRRLMVAVFGVWAMMLQAMLPFAGALAAETGDEFWVALCSTAGIENIYLGDDGDSRPDSTSNSAGCDVCTVCACTSGAGCGCGALKLVLPRPANLADVSLPSDLRLVRLSSLSINPTRGPPV